MAQYTPNPGQLVDVRSLPLDSQNRKIEIRDRATAHKLILLLGKDIGDRYSKGDVTCSNIMKHYKQLRLMEETGQTFSASFDEKMFMSFLSDYLNKLKEELDLAEELRKTLK